MNDIKIGEKSYKNIINYYIGSATNKDSKYIKVSSENSLCIVLKKFEEINENNYLTVVPTNESK